MSKTNAQHCCVSKIDYHENVVLGQAQNKFIKQELTLTLSQTSPGFYVSAVQVL